MDRSSEERSRLEKWPLEGFEGWFRKEFPGEGPFSAKKEAAMMAWQARAALEDRQEAAPEAEPPIAKEVRESLCPRCDRQMTRITVGMVYRCLSCYPLPPKDWKPPIEDDMEPMQNGIGGVPSEATPSKENASPMRDRPSKGHYDCPYHPRCDAPDPEVQPPSDEVVSAAMKIRDLAMDLLGYEHVGGKIATGEITFYGLKKKVAPEVQGTPTKECICPTETWTVDGSDMHDSMCEINHDSPVGTPQKETPPDVRVHGCAEHGEVSVAFCEAVGCTAPKKIPVTAEAEGVQGKEPQTPGRCPQCNSDKRWVRNITAIPVDGAETNSECCHPWHDTGTSPKYEPLDGATCDVRARDFHSRFSPISLQELQAFQSYERNDAFGSGVKSGEAAGRRSAITEMKEWAASGAQTFDARFYMGQVIAKCAELLEKTKP